MPQENANGICVLSEIEAHRWRFNYGQNPTKCAQGKHEHVSIVDAREMCRKGLVESVLIGGRECLLPLNIKKRIGIKNSGGYATLQALNC